MDFFDQINSGSFDEEEIKFHKQNNDVPLMSFVEDNSAAMSCVNCGNDMSKHYNGYTCANCGLHIACAMDTDTSINNKGNYNTSGGSTSLQIVGGNNKNTRQYIRNTVDYSRKQYEVTLTQITSYANAYNGPAIPRNILKQAAEYYHSVQQYFILRSFNRKACMAECLYRVLRENGYAKKPKEIVNIFKITPKDMSNGAAVLQELHSVGLISKFDYKGLPENAMCDFLRRYFKCLSIPDEIVEDDVDPNTLEVKKRVVVTYMRFCIDLITFIEAKKLATDCITTTKCSGAIYLLGMYRPKLNITKDKIQHHCDISKSTFTKFSNKINTLMFPKKINTCSVRIKNIFARNNIVTKFRS